MANKISKYEIATSLAILFHAIGLAGILFFNRDYFIQATNYNLMLMFALLLWTQKEKNIPFFLFTALIFVVAFVAEVIGVNSGLLFGDYTYGNVLGFKWQKVPVLVCVNWFIIIYCSGISIQTLLMKAINHVAAETKKPPAILKALSVIIDGATLAVAFDWLMEPAAIKLGFWQWGGDGSIPFYNYVSWFIISMLLLCIFHFCKFNKQNKFAINLLLIQLMFFLLLKTFLT